MLTYTFIINPVSGGKKKKGIVSMIADYFGETDVKFTEYAGHARKLAEEATTDVVVAVGGDGTVNEVASALVGTDKILGIVPCGSGDGLALHLGISRNYRKSLLQLYNSTVARMDCGKMNGKYFFCTAGVGFDAKVGLDFSKSSHRGLFTYISMAARNWFRYEPDYYRVSIDGWIKWEGKAVFITVGNADQWGNNAKICGGATVLDGQFDVTIVKPFKTYMFPPLIIRLMSGKVKGCDSTECLTAKTVVIERSSEGPAHFDGEPVSEGTKLEMEIIPSSLNVLIP